MVPVLGLFLCFRGFRVFLTSSSCRLVLLAFFWPFSTAPFYPFLKFSTVPLVFGLLATRGATSWATLCSITFPSFLLSCPCDMTLLFLFFSFSTLELCYFLHPHHGLLVWLLHAVSAGVGQYSKIFLEENRLSAAHIVLFMHTGTHKFQVFYILRRR